MAEMNDHQRQELEELVDVLGSIKGRHTELVSVLIPAGQNINLVQRQLEAEKSTAANIKSKQTRTTVITALETIIRKMKEYIKTPENGIAFYCGNVSDKEGVQDIQLWVYEPPKPLNTRLYRCDQEFVIEPLKEMLEVTEVYGLLVIDRQMATIGVLEGKQIKMISKHTSGVPGKVRAGGQCLSPETLVETINGKVSIKDINIGDKIKALDINNAKIIFTKCKNKWMNKKPISLKISTNKGNSLICSKDHTLFVHDTTALIEMPADLILKGALLLNTNQKDENINKIEEIHNEIELIDIETESKNFFANNILVHNSSQRFHRITEGLAKDFFRRIADEMKKVFFEMPRLKGILVGGPIPTKEEFLEEGDLVTKLKEKVISVKDIGYVDEHGLEMLVEESQKDIADQELIKEKLIIEKFFETLGKHREKAAYGYEKTKLALERGAVSILLLSKDVDKVQKEELEKMAENIGSEIVLVSKENQDGEQFYNITKGIGAILRFAIE